MKFNKKDTSLIWNKYYQDFEDGDWLGNQYPNEFLVRYVSNLRKKNDIKNYFNDKGEEIELKKNFKGKALEIGFGGLANLLMLSAKGFDSTGIEVSENSVKRSNTYIKKKKIKKIKTLKWDKNSKISFKDNTFDLVIGLQCIYYNTDIKYVIQEVRRILKKDGNFIFSFFSNKHGYMNYIDHVDKNIIKWSSKHPNKRIVDSEHYHVKSKAHLLKLFSDFKSKKVFTFETDQLPIFQSWWYINGKK